MNREEYDIYIKEEGYADVRLHDSQKAKVWCNENGYENSLARNGEKIWYPGMTEGGYKFGLNYNDVNTFTKKARKAGLKIYSEFE